MSERPPVTLRYAVHVPNLGRYGDPDVLVSLATEAEQAESDGFFLWDHMLHRRVEAEPVVDPWVTLAACAVKTERLRLGTMITPLSRRRPWKVARETMTLDLLSGWRVVLGAGLGTPRDAEFEAFGEEADDRRRAARLDEALTILAGLWSGEPFAFSGVHFGLEEMSFLPKPVQERIPIWIVATGRTAARFSVQRDGTGSSPRRLAACFPIRTSFANCSRTSPSCGPLRRSRLSGGSTR